MVHHIDGNPVNDRLNNLYIFANMGLHLNFEILIKHKIINRFVIISNLNQLKEQG
jgi:hypothetical protein